MKIGTKIRKIRLEQKRTQQEVADFLNISQKTYSNIESDKTAIRMDAFCALSALFGFDKAAFFEEKGAFKMEKPTFLTSLSKNNLMNTTTTDIFEYYNRRFFEQHTLIRNLSNRIKKLERKHKKNSQPQSD